MRDCVIVGAGLAGLTAATDLRSRGCTVSVLEARDRVGGRVESLSLPSGPVVDLGGQWISDSHTGMLALLERLRLQLVGATSGDVILRLAGQVTTPAASNQAQASLNPFEVADLGQGLARFRRLAQRIVKDPAWADANAGWLGQPMSRWARSNLRTPAAQSWFAQVFQAAFQVPLVEVSLADGLSHANAGVDLESLIAVNGGIHQQRVVGGMAQACRVLADELGSDLRLSTPVASVASREDQVVVTTRTGEHIEARRAIVALPPQLATALDHSPALEPWRHTSVASVPSGQVIKVVAVYPTRWWAERGYSGQLGADDGPVRVVFDVSDQPDGPGVLTGFFTGAMSDRTPGLREQAWNQAVTDAFGPGPAPIEVVERDWPSEEFTRGCHGAHFSPGVWTAAGPALTLPHGRIHYAGAEYSPRFNGYLEGALRSGQEAAAAVARELS